MNPNFERDRRIAFKVIILDRSLESIGKEYGITATRVGQITRKEAARTWGVPKNGTFHGHNLTVTNIRNLYKQYPFNAIAFACVSLNPHIRPNVKGKTLHIERASDNATLIKRLVP
tara:strand:+ start:175 stop:522 length:348 start_codon:yes stop_codon:yes gene_type:complete